VVVGTVEEVDVVVEVVWGGIGPSTQERVLETSLSGSKAPHATPFLFRSSFLFAVYKIREVFMRNVQALLEFTATPAGYFLFSCCNSNRKPLSLVSMYTSSLSPDNASQIGSSICSHHRQTRNGSGTTESLRDIHTYRSRPNAQRLSPEQQPR
jgi:hypothetical protein